MKDIGLLVVEGAVFHEVPSKSGGAKADPTLSTQESTLGTELEYFLRSRLKRSMADSAQPVLPLDDHASPVPELAEAWLRGTDSDIITPFEALPALLLEAQAHNSPEGLFAVLRCRVKDARAFAILKVEKEEGLSFESVTQGDETRIELVVEDGLVLTQNTRVFKAAVFLLDVWDESDGGIQPGLVGYVTDDQSGSLYRSPASRYWLDDFLGCRYARDADVQTRAWIKAMERAVLSDIDDVAAKDDVVTAMRSELASNRSTIRPAQFVDDYVPEEYQDPVRARLTQQGVTLGGFPKSREVSAKVPNRKTFFFEGDIRVSTPNDYKADLTTVTEDDETYDVLKIRGHVRNVQ